MLNNDKLIISFKQTFEGDGIRQGVQTSEDTVFARPYKVMVEKKKSIGKINFLIYNNKVSDEKFLLGCFCYTSYAKYDKRLIFFPGFLARKILWHSSKGDFEQDVVLDHFTIQPDFKTWHYTARKKGESGKYYMDDNPLFEIERDLYSWFSISINNLKFIEKVFSEYEISFPVESSELESVKEKLLNSKINTIEYILSQPEDEVKMDEFIHFDLLIDKRKNRKINSLSNSIMIPHLMPISETTQFPVKAFEIEIDEFPGVVVILVSKHKGKLAEDVIISSRQLI